MRHVLARLGLGTLFGIAAIAVQAQTPEAPTDLVIRPDDRVATLSWNGFDQRPYQPGANVGGYLVQWGPEGQPTLHQRAVRLPIFQVQPITNGGRYVASVRAISPHGRLSAPLRSAVFGGDGTRVESLRQRMTGFFDDFNLPLGDPNLHRWATAYSAQSRPELNGFFVNDQFHVHNMVGLANPLGRAFATVRARQIFDFTNRTGTIVFDLDGSATNEDAWYLDIVPNRMDAIERTNLDVHEPVGHVAEAAMAPPNSLRLIVNGSRVTISWFRGDGRQHFLAQGSTETFGFRMVPNIRRPFTVRLNRNVCEVRVDGHLVARTNQLNIPWTQGHVLWTAFQYEATEKWNQPGLIMHWDNFGFDAPRRHVRSRTLAFRPDLTAGADFRWSENFTPQRLTVNLDKPLLGARAARLHFTRQLPPGYWGEWNANDAVYVNGNRLAVPNYTGPLGPSNFAAHPNSINVPLAWLRTGANQVEFRAQGSGFGNLHFEVDYGPLGPLDAFEGKPPKNCPCCIVAATTKFALGPTLAIDNWGDDWSHISANVFDVSGVLDLSVNVNNDRVGHSTSLVATGIESRMARLELQVNRQVVQSIGTAEEVPAVGGRYVFRLDTRTLPNGVHELFVRGVSPEGYESVTDFIHGGGLPGVYRAVRIRVQN